MRRPLPPPLGSPPVPPAPLPPPPISSALNGSSIRLCFPPNHPPCSPWPPVQSLQSSVQSTLPKATPAPRVIVSETIKATATNNTMRLISCATSFCSRQSPVDCFVSRTMTLPYTGHIVRTTLLGYVFLPYRQYARGVGGCISVRWPFVVGQVAILDVTCVIAYCCLQTLFSGLPLRRLLGN